MFGSRNFTAFSFLGKIVKVSFEFIVKIVEEVTLNITSSAAANAAEIPENVNVKVISNDQLINTTSAIISSK